MKFILILAVWLSACTAFAQKVSTSTVIRDTEAYMSDFQYARALELLDRAEDSLDVGILQRRGLCYSRLGNYSDAIMAYEAIRISDSLNREALYHLGQLYAYSEHYEQAKLCYQKLIDLDSTNSFYYKQYASVSLRANDLVSGIAGYLQTVKLNPRDLEAYGQLAGILIEAEQFHFVDSMLTAVLSIKESKPLRLLLARANLGEHKYQAVIDNIEFLLIDGDTTATYARLLGISYFQMDEYQKVIPCMEFLIKVGVKADWMYYYLGVSYQQTNNPVKGIEFLNMAIDESISDNIGTYYTQLAMAYEEVKDFKNAIRHYKAAYETSKADILLYHLARNYDVYYKDKTQAQIYYKRYLESDDTIKMAKRYSQHRLDALTDVR